MFLPKWLFGIVCWTLYVSCIERSSTQSSPNVSVVSTSQSKQTAIKEVKVLLGRPASPLHRTEIEYTQWPKSIQKQIEFDEQVASIANLLRSPCTEGWYVGETLNESVLAHHCDNIASRWLIEIDNRLKANRSIEDILFSMVAPGPYVFSKELSPLNPVVYVDRSSWDTGLLWSRIEHLEMNLHKDVLVILTDKSSFVVIKKECLKNGQLLPDILENRECIGNNSTTEQLSLDDIATLTKPLWVIEGYQISGYQSNRQVSHLLTLP